MGLQTLARELARGQIPDFADQWQGLRTYWRVGLRAWLIAAAITITCALNAAFYATRAANAATSWHTIAAAEHTLERGVHTREETVEVGHAKQVDRHRKEALQFLAGT